MYSNNNFNSKPNITRRGLMHPDHRQQKNGRKLCTKRLTIINYYLLSLYFVKNTRSTRRAKDKMKLKAACCSSTLHCITPCLYYDQYIHPPLPPSLHQSVRLSRRKEVFSLRADKDLRSLIFCYYYFIQERAFKW